MLKEKIIEHLNIVEISYEYNNEGDRHSFFFDLDLSNDMVRPVIGLNNMQDYVIMYLLCLTPLPTVRTAEVFEYISRINYVDCFGAFVYDFEDSLVGYHCAFFIEQSMTHFETHFIRNFQLATEKIDFYIPGLLSVGFGGKEPALAINQLEVETDPTLN
jgi:hypothetical protein